MITSGHIRSTCYMYLNSSIEKMLNNIFMPKHYISFYNILNLNFIKCDSCTNRINKYYY